MYAWYPAEMLGIMSDYSQPIMTSSNCYKNIELTDSQALGGKSENSIHVSVSTI